MRKGSSNDDTDVVPGRRLAFEAGVLPTAALPVGVAQTHGPVCAVSSTGPPIGWLVMTSWAPTMLPSVAFAVMTFAPTLRPVTTPRMRPLGCCAKVDVMSVPSRSTLSVAGRTKPGVRISTRAVPPLTRSARFDKVVMVIPLVGGGALLSSPPPQAVRTNERTTAACAAAHKR